MMIRRLCPVDVPPSILDNLFENQHALKLHVSSKSSRSNRNRPFPCVLGILEGQDDSRNHFSRRKKVKEIPIPLHFWRRRIFSSTTRSNSSRRRCDEIGVFAFDSAQYPAHHSVFCPWSELAPLTLMAAFEHGDAEQQANAGSIAHSPDNFGEPTEWTTEPD
jgi:hypothetical protein